MDQSSADQPQVISSLNTSEDKEASDNGSSSEASPKSNGPFLSPEGTSNPNQADSIVFGRITWRHWSVLFVGVAYFLVAILPLLGYSRVFQVSEGREGVVVKAMVEQDNYVLPLRHQQIIPSKPLLFHWLSLGLLKQGSDYDEFQLRLPSVLGGMLLLAVTIALAAQLSSPATGLLAGLILTTTWGFARLSSDGRVDMVFVSLCVSAVFIALSRLALADENDSSVSINLTAVSVLCGLAILAKGPLGIVWPALMLFSLIPLRTSSCLTRQLFSVRWIWAVVIPLPWYVAAAARGGSPFIERQIVFENVSRFVGSEGISQKPWWFYIPELFSHAAPWSAIAGLFLAFPILRLLWTILPAKNPAFALSVRQGLTRTERFALSSCLYWIVITLIALSLSSGKRSAYLLFVLPLIAVTLAILLKNNLKTWDDALSLLRHKTRKRYVFWLTLLFLITALLPLLAIVSKGLPLDKYAELSLEASYLIEQSPALFKRELITMCSMLVFFTCLPLLLLIRGFRISSTASILGGLITYLTLLFYVTGPYFIALKGERKTFYPLARELDSLLSDKGHVTFIKTTSDESLDGLFFYLKTPSFLHDPQTAPETPGMFVCRKHWFDEQDETWQKRIQKVWTGTRSTDLETDSLVLFRVLPFSDAAFGSISDSTNSKPLTGLESSVSPPQLPGGNQAVNIPPTKVIHD